MFQGFRGFSRFSIIFVGSIFVLMMTYQVAQAGDRGLPKQLEKLSGQLEELSDKVSAVDQRLDTLTVQVSVDPGWCDGSIAVQCSGPGDSPFAPATSSNHNPVGLVIMVTHNGEPVTNLSAANFEYIRGFQPPVAAGLVRCDENPELCGTNLFLVDPWAGLYGILMHPFKSSTNQFLWTRGTYHGVVVVTDNEGRTGQGMAEIVIKE